MRILITTNNATAGRRRAFMLMEVLIGSAVTAIMFVTLYLGISSGFGMVQVARENLRATQILQDKMETIRLYTWSQINTGGFIPSSFTNYFYPTGNAQNSGTAYLGTMTVSAAPASVTESYSGDLRLITVNVSWQSGTVQRQRKMYSFVSQYGLHDYIY